MAPSPPPGLLHLERDLRGWLAAPRLHVARSAHRCAGPPTLYEAAPCHAGVTSAYCRYLSAVPQQQNKQNEHERPWVPPYEPPALGSFANPYIVPPGLPFTSPSITVRRLAGWPQGGALLQWRPRAPTATCCRPAPVPAAPPDCPLALAHFLQNYLADSIPLPSCAFMRNRMRTFR